MAGRSKLSGGGVFFLFLQRPERFFLLLNVLYWSEVLGGGLVILLFQLFIYNPYKNHEEVMRLAASNKRNNIFFRSYAAASANRDDLFGDGMGYFN